MALRACYDLACSPPTFDIVAFLMQVDQERHRRGDDLVEIFILPGPAGGFRADSLWPWTLDERRSILHAVAVPMCEMLPGATVSILPDRPNRLSAEYGHGRYMIGPNQFFSAYKQGVRPLRPCEQLPRNPKLITITLRECEHWPERNSNVGEWLAAAEALNAYGFDVIIVRDTRLSDAPLPSGYTADKQASVNLHARAKLYASAALNMFVNGGPSAFALALDVPVLIVRPTVEGIGAIYGDEGFAAVGIVRGGQIPGAPDHQRLAWVDDTERNIVRAAIDFISAANARAAA